MKRTNGRKTEAADGRQAVATRAIDSRYLSVKLEGHEIYCESVKKDGSIFDMKASALIKLELIRKALPSGSWTITIEQQWKVGYGQAERNFDVYNPEDDSIEENGYTI